MISAGREGDRRCGDSDRNSSGVFQNGSRQCPQEPLLGVSLPGVSRYQQEGEAGGVIPPDLRPKGAIWGGELLEIPSLSLSNYSPDKRKQCCFREIFENGDSYGDKNYHNYREISLNNAM